MVGLIVLLTHDQTLVYGEFLLHAHVAGVVVDDAVMSTSEVMLIVMNEVYVTSSVRVE